MAHLKHVLVICFLLTGLVSSKLSFAQFPDFLQGEWQVDETTFENWQKVGERHLRGVSYKLTDNQVFVMEYLVIFQQEKEIILRAVVVGQNEGKAIDFILNQDGERYVFSNPQHDFPKQIVYQLFGKDSLKVNVGGDSAKQFSYWMIRRGSQINSPNTFNEVNKTYDPELAKKLKADDYGMKSYFLVILTSGSANIPDTALIKQHFRGHLDNISRLVDEQLLVIAGPFGKNELKYRGLFIFQDVESETKLIELLNTDAAIASGLLDYVILPWYGSAAIPEYLKIVDQITKKNP